MISIAQMRSNRWRKPGSWIETLVHRHPMVVLVVMIEFAALASGPALDRLTYTFALLAMAAGAWVASRSLAIPLALGSVPPLVDAIVGYDPLPKGGFTFLFAAWIALAVGFIVIRGQHQLPVKALMCVPALASFALLGLMLLRLGVSPDESYGSMKVQLYVADVLIFFVGAVFVGARQVEIETFVKVSFFVAAAGALLFLFNLIVGTAQPLVGGRYSLAAQEYPIELGRASSDGLLIAIYLVLCTSSRRLRLLALACCPLLAVAMLAAGSRGPVVAFVLGLGALLTLTAVDARARRRLTLVAAAFIAAAILVPLIVPGSAVGRSLSAIIGSTSGLSSNGRSELWTVAISTFSQHFAFGLGWGGFASLGTGLLYPHNIFLEFASELGIVGLLLLCAVIGGSALRLVRVWRSTTGADKLLAALLSALFLTALINACFSGAVQDNSEVWLWAGIGIGMSARLAQAAAANGRRLPPQPPS